MELHVKSKKYNDADILEVKEDLALQREDLEVKDLGVTGNVEVEGGLVAKTLEQEEANWSYDLSDVNPTASGDFTVENVFSRLQVINKELEVIFSFKITNSGEASATPANVQLGIFDIPEEIGRHIIDVEGNNLTETPTSEKAIAGSALCNTGIAVGSTHNVFTQRNGALSISHQSANKMRIACYSLSSMSAGSETVYSGRIQLTLI